MIFDDDRDILSICTFIFKRLGWDVAASEDCKGILEKVRQERPDVILMDNWIPDEGGIAATRLLKSSPDLKDIPVIYFSANKDVNQLADEAGADSYLQKPFDLKEFENKVIGLAKTR